MIHICTEMRCNRKASPERLRFNQIYEVFPCAFPAGIDYKKSISEEEKREKRKGGGWRRRKRKNRLTDFELRVFPAVIAQVCSY